MMKTRAVRAAALATTLSLVLAGCGRDDDEAANDSPTTVADGESGGENTESAGFIDPATDCAADYNATQGINGDTITIGNVRPETGNYSIYGTVAKGLEAFVQHANSQGGITAGDGKQYKLQLETADDAYDPALTPGVVQTLVEQKGIFAMVGQIGTATNLAVRQYMNDNCVPSVALATGARDWGEAAKYPWYIGGLPPYATEAVAFIDYLKTEKPDATIALLYQDDDYGKTYQQAIAQAIEGTDITVVSEKPYNPLNETSPESKVAELATSNADVFFVGLGGTPCPVSLTKVPDTWTPMTFVSVTCSAKTAMSLLGDKEASMNVFAAQPALDPANPEHQADPAMQEVFAAGRAIGLDEATLEGGIFATGWNFGALFARGLENAETVTRHDVMNALWSLEDEEIGIALPGAVANTNGAEDPWPFEDMRIVHRVDGLWTPVTEVISYDGKGNEFGGIG